MDSAGNDVVAFRLTDPERSAQPRFYNQILSPSEIGLFHSGALPSLWPSGNLGSQAQSAPDDPSAPALSFPIFLWLCWSIKESVYKFRKRLHPELVFSPTSIHVKEIFSAPFGSDTCFPSTSEAGTHNFQPLLCGRADDIYFQSTITPDGIISVVHDREDFKGVQVGFAHTSGEVDQSEAVRAMLTRNLSTLDPEAQWTFGKHPDGYPLLYRNGLLQPIPLSFAHHGNLLGFSYLLPVS
jgi:hypothetical protein